MLLEYTDKMELWVIYLMNRISSKSVLRQVMVLHLYMWVKSVGFMDIYFGKVFSPPIWDCVSEFNDALSVVSIGNLPISCESILISGWEMGGKFGCIDLDGNIVVPVEYDSLSIQKYHNQRMILAEKNGFMGILDRAGKMILPLKYYYVYIIGTDCVLCLEQDRTYSFLYN